MSGTDNYNDSEEKDIPLQQQTQKTVQQRVDESKIGMGNGAVNYITSDTNMSSLKFEDDDGNGEECDIIERKDDIHGEECDIIERKDDTTDNYGNKLSATVKDTTSKRSPDIVKGTVNKTADKHGELLRNMTVYTVPTIEKREMGSLFANKCSAHNKSVDETNPVWSVPERYLDKRRHGSRCGKKDRRIFDEEVYLIRQYGRVERLTGDHVMFYTQLGEKGPVVICISAPPLDHYEWDDVSKRLMPYCSVYNIDLMNIGRSSKNIKDVSHSIIRDYEYIYDLYKDKGLDRVVLLGRGYGALLALLFATYHPKAVHKVYAISPPPRSEWPNVWEIEISRLWLTFAQDHSELIINDVITDEYDLKPSDLSDVLYRKILDTPSSIRQWMTALMGRVHLKSHIVNRVLSMYVSNVRIEKGSMMQGNMKYSKPILKNTLGLAKLLASYNPSEILNDDSWMRSVAEDQEIMMIRTKDDPLCTQDDMNWYSFMLGSTSIRYTVLDGDTSLPHMVNPNGFAHIVLQNLSNDDDIRLAREYRGQMATSIM